MRQLILFSLLTGLTATACIEQKNGDTPDPNADSDGDGYAADVDCDDEDAAVYPGAVDEANDTQCMKDADGDGFGDANPPEGYDAGTDCDDADPATRPGIAVQEPDSSLCMTDADGDGFGAHDGVGASGNDHYDDDPNRNILPDDGHWTYGEATILSNNCMESEDESPVEEAGFTLLNSGDQQFGITPDGSTDSTACTLVGNNYSCATSDVVETVEEQGIEIDIGVSTLATGLFNTDDSLVAVYALTFTCEGTNNPFVGCSLIEDEAQLPCTLEFSIPATLDAQ